MASRCALEGGFGPFLHLNPQLKPHPHKPCQVSHRHTCSTRTMSNLRSRSMRSTRPATIMERRRAVSNAVPAPGRSQGGCSRAHSQTLPHLQDRRAPCPECNAWPPERALDNVVSQGTGLLNSSRSSVLLPPIRTLTSSKSSVLPTPEGPTISSRQPGRSGEGTCLSSRGTPVSKGSVRTRAKNSNADSLGVSQARHCSSRACCVMRPRQPPRQSDRCGAARSFRHGMTIRAMGAACLCS